MLRPVRRFKISDSVAAQIEQLILSNQFRPGDRLPPERVLSDQLGVSRGSTREALRALEARGLVEIVHGIGVFVATAPEDADRAAGLMTVEGVTVPEFFEVRLTLECEAAALAAKRIRPAEAEELMAILERLLDQAISDEEFVEADLELHRAIVRGAKNSLMLRLFETVQNLFVTYSLRVIQLPGRREHANEGHRALVDAITEKRSQAARKAMSTHVKMVEEEILDYLAQIERGEE